MTDNQITPEYVVELQQYLQGLEMGMPESFFHLAEILKSEAFELCKSRAGDEYFIPYMMNDAVEYYLILRQARMTGEFLQKERIVSAQIAQEKLSEGNASSSRYILVIRQEGGNTCTVLFQELLESCQCYQYHRIGHFWVKGQEHWRRLVYIIGTIYDKYQYLGPGFCNEQEMELLELMGFAPFRYWSPIHESLDAYYEDTQAGVERMKALAEEAGDKAYGKLIGLYKILHFRWMARILGHRLLAPKRQGLYELLEEKIEKASIQYPTRDYGAQRNREIEEKRRQAARQMQAAGYEGTYPTFERRTINPCEDKKGDAKNPKDGRLIQVCAVEEHPYVRSDMEYEDFEFQIYLMEIEKNQVRVIRWENMHCGIAKEPDNGL